MQIFIWVFSIGIVVGGVFVWLAFAKRKQEAKKEESKDAENPLDAFNEERKQQKQEAKQKILQLLAQKRQITNDNVEQMLHVSHATATNYLQELENEGSIEQQGDVGRGVFYALKNN
jgi:predicted HTH transcriptional regulator